jgi:hypothetical protein
MTTYSILKRLGNKRGGIYSRAILKKAEAPAPAKPPASAPAQAVSVSNNEKAYPRAVFFLIAMSFLASFWLIFQVINMVQLHDLRFQRLISAMDHQSESFGSLSRKISAVSSELPKLSEDINVVSRKADSAWAETVKMNKIISGQSAAIKNLIDENAALAKQTQTASNSQ